MPAEGSNVADGGHETQKLGPDNGRVVAVIGLVFGVVAVVTILQDGPGDGALGFVAVVLVLMVLIWSVLLRPAVFLGSTTLRLRNAFVDVFIPLASVEAVSVRQMMVVHTVDRGFHSTALTRHRRELTKRDQGKVSVDPLNNFADFVEERINARAEDARARGDEVGPTRRRPAWAEISALAVLLVAAAVFFAR
ncbi:MAG: hypothetical protein L0H93_09550 [Nocardioides sp.]|nr:hypothetical protein [Nocardioides sp.]